ncbi:intercellular adhesion molecule 2 [Molossus molossus]|uniref:Intercellular adhesion molecule 2 n=2 Tax=Molossus molossus TaxID=27622 RepID=A0A7J8CYS7_MOLMO|nr:intercellular adhesion molecule 2 [Molossus molossus]KAF6415916.1 intercellular adhesion molecule 2 [Molossus molossus]
MPFEMSPFCCWGLPMALLALIVCPGSGEEAFQVYMWPEQQVVKLGGSWEVNCSTSCLQPEIGGVETTLSKTLLDEQPQWKLYRLSNISEDTVMYCYFTCSGKQVSANASISVYHPPEQVLLKLQPTWVTVGKSFTIECRVQAVAPLENLTLTLLRGKEPLHMQTFGRSTAAPQEAVITHNSTAHKDDGRHNFSCQAELDLRSRGGGIIRRTSEPQVLEIHEPGQDNQMVIIITVVSVLLLLFVSSVLLCFIFGQQWHQRRIGSYGVQAAWSRLRQAYQA